jgi:thiamine pyrophosphokinase
MKTVLIIADGEFPTHAIPLKLLDNAETIICCDGAAKKLIQYGIVPAAIVGDMDSLEQNLQVTYRELIHQNYNQETNDLTKSFDYALSLNPDKLIILGATGAREDHAIGNISLLSLYRERAGIDIEMFTNNGRFIAVHTTSTINIPAGSYVSIFSLDTNITIESLGLKYPLKGVVFDAWWKGTLNETTEESFTLTFKSGRVIIFIPY